MHFSSTPPQDVSELSREWHRIVDEIIPLTNLLPPEQIGTCVCRKDGNPFNGDIVALQAAIESYEITYRQGHIRGVLPNIVIQ